MCGDTGDMSPDRSKDTLGIITQYGVLLDKYALAVLQYGLIITIK